MFCMKKLFIIIVTLLAFFSVEMHAQSLVVQSFDPAPKDLTANTPGTMVKDQNGETCALIKVETVQKGFTFDVGILGVVDVVEHPAEIWVYVPFGVRKMTMQHPQLGMLRDYEIPCQIEKGRTYIMRISTGTVRTIVETASTKQFLYISLEPANAILQINGEVAVTNNGVYNKLHSFGKYEYRATCPDYHDAVGVVNVSDPENAHRVILKLEPAFGFVSVSSGNASEVSGAMVYVDGKHIGSVPVNNLKLSSGSHQIRILKPLYKVYESTFEVVDNDNKVLVPELIPNFADLTLQAVPGAKIFVNGEEKGTDKWKGVLEYGEYVFEVRKDGHLPASISYNVSEKDQAQTVILPDPIPVYGTLAITSEPFDAKVYIDGEYVGVTPKYIAKQIIGDHLVKVELEGYAPQSEIVTVVEGEDADVVFSLIAQSSNQISSLSVKQEYKPVASTSSPKQLEKLKAKAKKLDDKGKYIKAKIVYVELGEQGDLDAQMWLADYYSYDNKQAVYWYRKAAEQGSAYAQNRLGLHYDQGKGVTQSSADAVYWFRLAAEQGNMNAQNNLAICYYNGEGVERNYSEAVKWYRKAAEQGHAGAQNGLGVAYYQGRGVAQNYTEAIHWYRKSADQGNKWAYNNLGHCYHDGKGVTKDYKEAVKWYRKSAEQGYHWGQCNLADCYYSGKGIGQNYAEAVKWYRKAAEQNNSDAQNALGNCYYNGKGVEKDYAEAVKWYRKSAEQGHHWGQCNLAGRYYSGEGVVKDYTEAVKWYRKSAEQGNSQAQNGLGNRYYAGEGVEKDYAEAVKWYRKSAEQGYHWGQYNLANCYYNGRGVTKNRATAIEWFKKAADQGNEDAKKKLKEIGA